MLGRLISKPMRMISKGIFSKSFKLGALLVSSGLLAYGVKASGMLKKKGAIRTYVRSQLKPVVVRHARTTTHQSSRVRHH